MRKKARNKSDVNKEGVTYQSGVALTLDPQLLQRAVVAKEKLKEFEKDVPSLTIRPQKKFITCHADDLKMKPFVIISFDTETNCGGKEAGACLKHEMAKWRNGEMAK